MKNYILFVQTLKIYKLGANKNFPETYISYTGDEKVDSVCTVGFDIKTVEKNPRAFIFGDDTETLEAIVRELKYAQKYGDGSSGDCKCPKCGRFHSFDYMDYNDGYYTPAIRDDFSEVRTCFCGCKFIAKIKVEISFSAKIIN